jgi:hypothetical protein
MSSIRSVSSIKQEKMKEKAEIIHATVVHEPVPGSNEETTTKLRSIGQNLKQNTGVRHKIDKDTVLLKILG